MLGIAQASARTAVNMPMWATGFLETHEKVESVELQLELKSQRVEFMGKTWLYHSG